MQNTIHGGAEMITKTERAHWNLVAELGCLPCAKDGFLNTYVSIHHCDGRTKPGAHMKVLALCAGHHQKGTNINAPHMIAIHPDKRRFQEMYGTQQELMLKTNLLLKKK